MSKNCFRRSVAVACVIISTASLSLNARAEITEVTLKPSSSSSLTPNQAVSDTSAPLWVNVSLDQQSLRLFRGGKVIEQSNISSGKSGHDTPTGIFSILGKKKYHESNIYSSAPMPFMQRLTWSGIALHESNSVPSFPASHGCVRLPKGFAEALYKLTPHGTHVVISKEEIFPGRVDHPSLFQKHQSQPLMSLRPSIIDTKPTGGIRTQSRSPVEGPEPLRIYVTRTTTKDKIVHLQKMLSMLNHYTDRTDGIYGAGTIRAVKAFQSAQSIRITGTINDETIKRLQALTRSSNAPAGMIYVRVNKKPVFEMPIQIRDPEKPLGTHLLLTTAQTAASTEWIAMDIASRLPSHVLRDNDMDKELKGKRLRVDTIDALDRIIIPDSARSFIETHLMNGSSYAISDNGIGTETGDGTDFIVQTF